MEGGDSPDIDSQRDTESKGNVQKLCGVHRHILSVVCGRHIINNMSATKRELLTSSTLTYNLFEDERP